MTNSRARLTAYARLAFEIQTPEATPLNFNTATVQGVWCEEEDLKPAGSRAVRRWKWAVVVCTAGMLFAVHAAGRAADKPVKKSDKSQAQAAEAHKKRSEAQREKKDALTSEVSRYLPRSKRAPVERKNYIDEYIFGKMERDSIPHDPLASDQEFVRRVYLDLTGRIPDPEVVRKFLKDQSPDKRDRLIDSLVSPERFQFQEEDPFVDRWTYWFCDLYSNSSADLGTQGRNLFYDYIRFSFRLNRPYNQMVEEMLTATALTNFYSGPANFLTRFHVDNATGSQIHQEDTFDEMAIATARILLGLNLECVSCHSGIGHLEQINLWLTGVKRADVWRQAAFFSDITMYRPPSLRQEFTVLENGQGYDDEAYPIPDAKGYNIKADSVVRMPRWKADVSPTFLLTGEQPAPNKNLREEFARMVISHPQFARATVNYIWAELMGVGIVDPPYDFDLARQDPNNPIPEPWTLQPTHPELLDALAKDLREHQYDLRYLIKLITKSSAYQLSAVFDGEWKSEYARYFARRFARRLTAEELFDSISIATGVFPEIPILGTNIKVKYVMQTRSPEDSSREKLDEIGRFLASFGQDSRSRGVKSLEGNMIQASLLLNSKIVKDQVKAVPGSRLHKLLNQEPALTNQQLVEELFLATLSRFPTAEEKEVAMDQIQRHRDRGAEDVLWALLNKLDFVFNY